MKAKYKGYTIIVTRDKTLSQFEQIRYEVTSHEKIGSIGSTGGTVYSSLRKLKLQIDKTP